MAVFANDVKMTISGTPGTGTATLSAAFSNAYCTAAEAGITNGQVVRYRFDEGNDFEIGLGTYTSAGTTISRDTVNISKIAGTPGTSKMSLTSAATFRIVVAKEDLASLSAGGVLQCLSTTYATNASLTTAIPIDDTVPLSTEGTQILSQAITCRDANSKVLVLFTGWGITDVGGWTAAIFRGTTNINTHLATDTAVQANATPIVLDSPASASAQTYTVRVGPTSGNTLRLNGTNAARFFGAASLCTLTVMEIAV